MKVLITNRGLVRGTGTEIVTRDLALELRRLGHEPVVYSPVLGPLAAEIRTHGIPVCDDLRKIDPIPDIIHGHHHPQTLAALLRFPATPAISVCHDATAWHDDPLIFPRVLRYVAVDHRCRKRLEKCLRVPNENIRAILNAVDLSRFQPRSPLPEKPRHAAIFSNYATKRSYATAVSKACEGLGLQLDVIGKGFNTATPRPEEVLPQYDIVFAKARCALEAMVTGSAVVLCDFAGLGVMVSSEKFAELRQLNFGAGTLVRPLDPELIAAEIQKYDAKDARLVSERTRKEASLTSAITEWVDLYEEVVADWQQREHPVETRSAEEMAAIAEYLETWGYDARITWEKAHIERLQGWPILGRWFTRAVNREKARLMRN